MNRPPTFRAIEVKTRELHVYTEMHLFPTHATRATWIDERPYFRHACTAARAREEGETAEEHFLHMTPEENRSRGSA